MILAKERQLAAIRSKYIDMGHAEITPPAGLDNPPDDSYYLPMHSVKRNVQVQRSLELSLMHQQILQQGAPYDILLPGLSL